MTGPARSRPAPTEGFWEGLFRQSRRDQSRHSMDLGAVPFSSPPHPQSFQPGSSSWMRPRCKGRVHFGNGK